MTVPSEPGMSVVGRLLAEISWERATSYRQGGRGRENVLSAEVLMALDFLPRNHFLGGVLRAAHGADETRAKLISEIEETTLDFLPGDWPLNPVLPAKGQIFVQADAVLESTSTMTLIEAKRIRSSSFQVQQLAREFVATISHAGTRQPMILLMGVHVPVRVSGRGLMSIEAAVAAELESVLARAGDEDTDPAALLERIPEVFCSITWQELAAAVESATEGFESGHASVDASIQRVARSLTSSIRWHA